jgi:2-keto-4-pentenoate hydratase/2-oxohepta-3-ene-1,7-dioic acid hydratase in catechol pathway
MKLYRLQGDAGPRWAKQEGDALRLLDGDPFAGLVETKETQPLLGAALLSPVTPSKVVAIGLNYRDHAAERGKPIPQEPLVFLKPSTSVIGPGDTIRIPGWAGRIDHEAELGIVIGKRVKDLASPEAAQAAILGAVCVNDVTARELQDKDVQFTRAKGFDTFCPVGPCIAAGLETSRLAIEGRVNGEVRQKSTTAELIFDPAYLVWFVSRVMTLLPGDIISSGTPAGIGPLRPGDEVEVEVEGVGVLKNRCA